MTRSETFVALPAAMAKAQGEIEGAIKGNVNPAFRSKYADLASVWDACRVPLSKNELAVFQPASVDGSTVTVTTLLTHSSGEWISSELTIASKDPSPHAIGTCITYARRFSLAAMVGIAPEDDDGNAASKPLGAPPSVETAAPKPTGPVVIPSGSVLLQKTEQHVTSKGKPYWLIVLQTGEEIITWEEQAAAFAEQACQNGEPVVISTKGGDWDGKPVARTIHRADIPPVAKSKGEAAAAEIFKSLPTNERAF